MKSQEDISTHLAEKKPIQLIDSSDCGAIDISEDDFSCSDQIIIRRPKIKTRFNSVLSNKEDKIEHIMEALRMDRDYYLCVENKRKFAEFLVQNNCLDIYEWLEASMKEGICVDKKCNIFYKIEKKYTQLNRLQISNIHQKNISQKDLELIKQGAQLHKKNKNLSQNQIRDIQILYDQDKHRQQLTQLKILQEKRRRQHHTNNLKYIRENLPHLYDSDIKIEDARRKIQNRQYDLEPLNQHIDKETIMLNIQNYRKFYNSFGRIIQKKLKILQENERAEQARKRAEYKRKKLKIQEEKEPITVQKDALQEQENIQTHQQKNIIEDIEDIDDYELSENESQNWKRKTEQLEQKIFTKMQCLTTRQSERLADKRLKQLEELYKKKPKPMIIVDLDSNSDSDSYYIQEGQEDVKLRYLQPVCEFVRTIQCNIPIVK